MATNDNRNYNYTNNYTENRPEYSLVCSMMPENSSVIDLGCGEGSLMQKLMAEKKCRCSGIEISASGVEICRQKGFDVTQGKIDEPLSFNDNSFDVALCNVTLQMVTYPEITVKEMERIASKKIIISFPNFAYWLNRIEMLIKGRMPQKLLFGYTWYSTGHIHQFSLKDAEALIRETGGLSIKKIHIVPTGNRLVDIFANWFPNMFGKILILEIEKK